MRVQKWAIWYEDYNKDVWYYAGWCPKSGHLWTLCKNSSKRLTIDEAFALVMHEGINIRGMWRVVQLT